MNALSFSKPSTRYIARFLEQQAKYDFNYPDVGATRGASPSGYDHHRIEIEVGRGEAVFQRAKSALQAWKQFDVGWVDAWPTNTPIREGENIAICGRICGLWALAACRIVHIFDEDLASHRRFGFAFGTLPGHPEQGEEQFEITYGSGSVVMYRIHAFFRPNYLSTKLAWPYFRQLFNTFRQQSADTLVRQCQSRADAVGGSPQS